MEDELKFEKALEKLERIVEDLEAGNMPLDEALKKYEEGVKLSRTCTQKLNQAENKVEVLTRSLKSTQGSVASEGDAGGRQAAAKKPRKSKRSGTTDAFESELLA